MSAPDSSTLAARSKPNRSVIMPEGDWQAEEAAHEARVQDLVGHHIARRERQQKHPVYDFLFEYYSIRRSHLKRWHPGIGIHLEGQLARKFLDRRGYRASASGITADPTTATPERLTSIRWIHALLTTCANRSPQFACYGLHEWAMVYRNPSRRHSSVPLRLSDEATERIVNETPICCSHFDAFRFFTPEATPLNRFQLGPEDRLQHEQRGCLHVNMDLFKWAGKLLPWSSSDLLTDTLELAMTIREIDMRASPYDLSAFGFTPIPIETPEGRREYEVHQRQLAARAEPLRRRLIEVCEAVLKGSGLTPSAPSAAS